MDNQMLKLKIKCTTFKNISITIVYTTTTMNCNWLKAIKEKTIMKKLKFGQIWC